jgi:hypothetical protein
MVEKHDPKMTGSEGGAVCIAVFSSRQSAELARSVLAGSGIQAIVDSDDYGGLHPALAMTHGVRLLVSGGDAEKARELLTLEEFDDLVEGE